MGIFEYNKSKSWSENYHQWRLMNNDERLRLNLRDYTKEQAKEVFNNIYPRDENRKT